MLYEASAAVRDESTAASEAAIVGRNDVSEAIGSVSVKVDPIPSML